MEILQVVDPGVENSGLAFSSSLEEFWILHIGLSPNQAMEPLLFFLIEFLNTGLQSSLA